MVLGAFLLMELLLDASYGQTIGKRVVGIRVIRVDGDGLAPFRWLVLRTVLLGVLVPPVVWDRDRRGLHDRAAGTVVVVDPNKAASGRSHSVPVKPAGKAPAVSARPGKGPQQKRAKRKR